MLKTFSENNFNFFTRICPAGQKATLVVFSKEWRGVTSQAFAARLRRAVKNIFSEHLKIILLQNIKNTISQKKLKCSWHFFEKDFSQKNLRFSKNNVSQKI